VGHPHGGFIFAACKAKQGKRRDAGVFFWFCRSATLGAYSPVFGLSVGLGDKRQRRRIVPDHFGSSPGKIRLSFDDFRRGHVFGQRNVVRSGSLGYTGTEDLAFGHIGYRRLPSLRPYPIASCSLP
jgi:hypothetical protein